MSVGSKIRKYRELLNITQKELGRRLGFSEISSDVRIRQYESGKMTPKPDLLKSFAKVLGVPVEALTDHKLDNDSDFIRTLFDMEDRFGLTVDKKDDEYILLVDDSKEYKAFAQTELSAWYKERKKYLVASQDITINTSDAAMDYDVWKSKYPKPTTKVTVALADNINAKYQPLKEQIMPFHPANMAEFVRHFEQMAKEGIKINIARHPQPMQLPSYSTRFLYSQLMELDGKAAILFAKYLTALDYLKEIHIFTEVSSNMLEDDMVIDYMFLSINFTPILHGVIDNMLNHVYAGNMDDYPFHDDYEIEMDRLSKDLISDPSDGLEDLYDDE